MAAVLPGSAQGQPDIPSAEASGAPNLAERYRETLQMTEVERRQRLFVLAEAEHRLRRDELRELTRARLQMLLRFDDELEAEEVERLVASIETVMDRLPGELAMRRVEFVQTLRQEFSPAEQQRLQRLVPGVLGKRSANGFGPEDDGPPVRRPPRWQFWRR